MGYIVNIKLYIKLMLAGMNFILILNINTKVINIMEYTCGIYVKGNKLRNV